MKTRRSAASRHKFGNMISNRHSDQPPDQRHAGIRRLSITSQIYLAVLVLALALLAMTVVAWIDSGRQAELRFENEIENGSQVFQADFNRALHDLTALGNWLASQGALTDLVQSRSAPGLVSYLEPWAEVNLADSIIVADREGKLIAQVGIGQVISPGASLTALPGLSDALLGKKTSGLAPDPTGRLQGRYVLPVYSADRTSIIGVILLAFYVDGSFLQYQARPPDQEIALVYDGKMSILTLTDSQGHPWTRSQPSAEVLKAQRENRPSEFVKIQTDTGTYLFQFNPLGSPSNNRDAMYGIGISLGSIDDERASLFRTFGVGILIIALGAGVGGFMFARTLTRPIQVLSSAVQAMAGGDLTTSIRLRRDDELGDLARQMDSMRQQLLEALQSAHLEKSRSAAVIQSMGAAAVVTDRNLNIVAVNPAAEGLLREVEANLVGQPWIKVFADGQGAQMTSLWNLDGEASGAEQSFALRGRFNLRARPQTTVDVISTQVELAGQPAGYVHILQDVTAQEQTQRAQDEFIMNAAHELRGPLASLRASIELLVEDYAVMPRDEMAVMLRTLQRAVVKFQGLVENIIDIGNIQAGKFRVRPSPNRLDTMIADALAQISPLFTGRGQRVEVNCPVGCTVLADRPRIVQVLINLLTNASKYGPEGEVIGVRALTQDGFAVIEVTDRGPGIPPEEQVHLFQRFYRGRRAEEEGMGIGLGLALAREIVEAHRGQMDVRSQLGEGTTFWFSLPMADQNKG